MKYKYEPVQIKDKKLNEDQIEDLVQQICLIFDYPMPEIRFVYRKCRSYCAMAYHTENLLKFSYPYGFNISSVIHEMSHLLNDVRGHGEEFQLNFLKIALAI